MAGTRKTAKSVESRPAAPVKASIASSVPAGQDDISVAPKPVHETKHAAVQTASAQTASTLVVVDASLSDLHEYVRKSAEENLEKTRAAYERFKTSAEEATAQLETSYSAASAGINALQAKSFEALRQNAAASFELVKALMGVKTLSEALQLQHDHARKQFEAVSGQVQDISALAQKVAAEAAEPLKSSLTKAFAA
jgi:phasin